MKRIIHFLFVFLLCSISKVSLAQQIDINTAKTVAKNHLESIAGPALKSTIGPQNTINFTSVIPEIVENEILYYILNDTINKAFVIVSADQRAWPILAYSTQGSFNENDQPEAFNYWMENRKKEIEYIISNDIQPDDATIASWKNLSLKSTAVATTSVEPLIKTQWGQECNYNAMCPTDAAGQCGHAFTGCTATAMAQIMKFWNFPTTGIGSHSYYHHTYGTLSADFGSTTYQWDQMPDKVTSPNDAVATLMYHCGVALEMDYGPDASAAYFLKDALTQYFGYSSNAILVDRALFDTNDWINILKSELDLGRPIYYTGDGSVGHSFICDGYQGEDYFHFNWGWSGSSDGYFYIGNLNPAWYNFNENQAVAINIVPGNLPEGYQGLFLSSNKLDVANEGDTASVDVCSSTNWTALSDQSWLTLSTNAGGAGKTTLTLVASENESGGDRFATVTISATGYSDQKVTVSQRTAVHVTPNGLYDAISQNAVSIKKLKLTGSIDARDFRFMRDAMPALTEVDLSEVTIVAYTGMDGTVSNNNWVYPANTIPEYAFSKDACKGDYSLLKSIVLPATTASIGASAFGNCKYLSTIDIPASVTNIGIWAFSSCNALIHVDANNLNYSSIDGVLFNKDQTLLIVCPASKTGTYTIPPSVTNIEQSAFERCNSLTHVIIPSSVTTIENMAFQYCNGMTSVTIPSSVTTIEYQTFNSCSALISVDPNNPNYSSIDGILFNKDQTELIQFPTSKTGAYSIPPSVNKIGNMAFTNCIELTDVIIPSTINSLGSGVFVGCLGLTTITIPESVISIEPSCFFQCSNLATVTIPSSIISIGNGVFSDCKKLRSIYSHAPFPVDLTLSTDVFRSVNKDSCTLYIPYGSKDAYNTANEWKDFKNMVEMPGIFLSDYNLNIKTDAGTTVIVSSSSNWNAESDQEWLTIDPSSGIAGCDTISFIASAISTSTTRTATVTISATGINTQTITVTQYGVVEVSAGNLKTALEGQFSTISSLTLTGIIDARDFKTMRDDMPALTSIDLSDVTIAAYSGTEGTGGTDNLDYEANGVPRNAFFDGKGGKASLNSIILPQSVTSIGYHAFRDCVGLSDINIPPQTISIKNYAFTDCKGLKSIIIPSSVIIIDKNGFYKCSAFFNVDINNQYYSSIDGILFNKKQTELLQCPATKSGNYTIPSSVTSIGDYSFYYSTLSSIIIPSSVISIGTFAFGCCMELTTITIPSSVTAIKQFAFGDSYKLNTVFAYPTSPVDLSSSPLVFVNIDIDNSTLHVPYGSKAAYSVADQWKDFKNILEMPNQVPLADAGPDLMVEENSIFNLDGTASNDPESHELTYLWTAPAGFTVNSNTDPMPTFTAPEVSSDTTYTISLVVNDGTDDSASDEVQVTVLNKVESGLEEINNSNEFHIFPNPTTGELHISISGPKDQNFTIGVYNGTGELKLSKENATRIDLSSFSNGIYFIKLNTKTQSYIQKIIKK